MLPRSSLLRPLTHLIPSSHLPSTYLLPLRATLATATASTTPTTTRSTSPNPPPGAFTSVNQAPPPPPLHTEPATHQPTPPRPLSRHFPLPPPTSPKESSSHLLPLLAAQPPHYITTHIHLRPYLLTAGDLLRLPFLLPDAPVGTVLRLNRASMLGSRDYTLRGDPWIDEKLFVCRVVVVGVEGEPMREKIVKKRRNRRVRKWRGKGRFTLVRVREVRVLAEGESDAVQEEGEDI